jgi:small subunit ribosomal protein S2
MQSLDGMTKTEAKRKGANTMAVVNMKTLLESGVHFGHRTHKWNPHMRPYIFTERNGIHIINLQLTVKAIEEAYALIRESISRGGTVLFVGTKRQAQETIQIEAERCGMPYVTARWLGGFLTNWRTIRERISELERLERMKSRGDFERVKKKERLQLQRKIDKLETRLGGIRSMIGLPDMLFVVDVRREDTAIHEANLLDIPVVAMVDTNCDPRSVDYVIPSNDDAIRAIKLMVATIADAVIEGKNMRKEVDAIEEEQMAAAAELDTPAERRVVVDEGESELTDEELLGEATLAKLQVREAEAAAIAEAQAEKAAEAEATKGDETAEGEAAETQAPVAEEGAEAAEAEVVAEEEVEEVEAGDSDDDGEDDASDDDDGDDEDVEDDDSDEDDSDDDDSDEDDVDAADSDEDAEEDDEDEDEYEDYEGEEEEDEDEIEDDDDEFEDEDEE